MKTSRQLLNLKALWFFLAGLFVLAVCPATAAKYTITLVTDQLRASGSSICALDNRGQVLWREPAETGQTKIWRYHQGFNTLLGTYPYSLDVPSNNGINNKYYNNHDQLAAYLIGSDAYLLNGANLIALTQSAVTNYRVEGTPKITDSGYLAWREFHFVSPYVYRIVRYLNGSYLFLDRGPSSGVGSPRVNNLGQMAWHEALDENNQYQIFFYDGATTVNITNDSRIHQNPMINDRSEIIWWRQHETYDGASDLMRWSPGDPAPQVLSSLLKNGYNLYLLNNSGQIVYVASGGPGNDGLHFYQDGVDTFIESCDWVRYPALNEKGQVAYENNYSNVKLYDHRTGIIQVIKDKSHYRGFLQINEAGQILYADVGGIDPTEELFLANPIITDLSPITSLLLD